ncbi:MAG: EVE domain-containing protein [Calditrichaeota bacterium]|nr:MAG: EVE domain-containing protein [Calditrichota bacterium]
MKYWLLKSEPNTYSWSDLKNEKDKTTTWEGVRNYQARNIIRDEMAKDDLAFFYHSVVKPMAIVGIVRIVRAAYPDYFAFDPTHKYYDPKSKKDNPTWYMVDVQAVEEFITPITLTTLKSHAALHQMRLLQKGSRLSVQPVSHFEWEYICGLSKRRKV